MWSVVLGIVILGVFSLIPLLGVLVVFSAITFGAGALALSGWQAYHGAAPAVREPIAAQAPAELKVAA